MQVYKTQAQRLAKFLKGEGIELPYNKALHAIANIHGHANWQTLRGKDLSKLEPQTEPRQSPPWPQILEGCVKAMRKALPFLPADNEALFVGEWLDDANELLAAHSSANVTRFNSSLEPKVSAKTYSDDRVYEVKNFDATAWFAQASDQEISDLIACEFGGDYPADAVAHYMADHNQDIAAMFDYLNRIADRRHGCGFECHVDQEEAVAWILKHRPHLIQKTSDGFSEIPEVAILQKANWHGEHPRWTRANWKYEVDSDNTHLGYWEWVEHRIEEIS